MMPFLLQSADWIGRHSALEPVGPQAARIHALWRFMWIVSALVFVAVVSSLLYASLRAHDSESEIVPRGPEPRVRRIVSVATAATVAVLLLFLTLNFATGRPLTRAPERALRVRITGHQWWWDITYASDTSSDQVSTANELHIPVGRPVVVQLESADVIHSFWVPNLVGKRDLIPRKSSSLWLQADSAGVYRGQCAEYCGYQHAKMGLLVVAESPEEFAAWLARQRDSAHTPTDSTARRGRQVFLATTCVMCHTISGTPAGSRVGPNLTHVASHRTIAAGTLPNTRENLARWILDPQVIKPGTLMPPNRLAPGDLSALSAYLSVLK